MTRRTLMPALLPLALAACATTGGPKSAATVGTAPPAHAPPVHAPNKVSPYAPAQEDLSKRGDYVAGGLFRPGEADRVPSDIPDVDAIPEPEVRDEPLARTGNRDYAVLGKRYKVLESNAGYVEEGMASYYGSKFHGRRTSSQEVYDMYAFTGAHKTLPLPSFARVTNLENGKTIVVRINDRGPFHPGRVIDLSYAAAVKLGYRNKGSARVRVEALTPDASAPAMESSLDRAVAGLSRPAVGMTPAMQPNALAPAPAQTPRLAAADTDAGDTSAAAVTLQVASYSNPQNAQHALSQLRDAAIAQAQLQDVDVNGKKLWRLRVGPVAEAAATELASRIAGLGFGLPQRVRD